jgi:4-amino-4-deoxy-L-arabinose transferase-like glycosyltransferase
MNKVKTIITSHYQYILLALIFIAHVFFQFYNLEKWAPFGWDQVDNAWAAMRILVAHKYPLLGMVAKQNSGMYIGPMYYYLVALFYYFTRYNPIASPILAGYTAIFSFICILFVSRRLFSLRVAIWSCFIYSFSIVILTLERNQWPVNFIAPLSILILYFLYQSIKIDTKYLIATAFFVGISFHIHFTAIFYPIIILCTLPLLPRNKKTVVHFILALLIFLILQTPQIIYYFHNNTGATGNYSAYFHAYYHGFHLRRVLQIAHDAFIEFQAILEIPYVGLRPAVFIYIPLFIIAYIFSGKKKKDLVLPYLVCLWIIIPWLIFSTYRGELTNYYFSLQMYLAIIIFAYLTVWFFSFKKIYVSAILCFFWIYFAYTNVYMFFALPEGNLLTNSENNLERHTSIVKEAIRKNEYIYFVEGSPNSYLYYYQLFINHKPEPYRM